MKPHTILGLLFSSPALAEDNFFDYNLCNRSSYFLNSPRSFEVVEFPGINLGEKRFCKVLRNENISLSTFFQKSGIERELNFESSFNINQHLQGSLFLDYQNPTRDFNTGLLVSTEPLPNFQINIGLLEPLDSENQRQILLGAKLKF